MKASWLLSDLARVTWGEGVASKTKSGHLLTWYIFCGTWGHQFSQAMENGACAWCLVLASRIYQLVMQQAELANLCRLFHVLTGQRHGWMPACWLKCTDVALGELLKRKYRDGKGRQDWVWDSIRWGSKNSAPVITLSHITMHNIRWSLWSPFTSSTMFLHCPSFIFLSSLLRGVFIYLPVLCMCQTPCSSSLGSAFMLCVVVYGLE